MDVKELVANMTLEEKAGLCSGQDFWHTKAVERLQIPAMMVSDGLMGSGNRMRAEIIWESMKVSKQSAFRQVVRPPLLLTESFSTSRRDTGKGMSGRGSRGYFRTCGQY